MAQGDLLGEFDRLGLKDVSNAELLTTLSLLYDHMPCCAKLIDDEAYLLSMGLVGRDLMEVEDFSALRGICWLDVWRGEYNEKAVEAFERAKQQGYAQFEGFAFTAKHTPKWWRVTLLRVTLGGRTLYFSLSEDITSERGYSGLEEDTSPSQEFANAASSYTLMVDDHGRVVEGLEQSLKHLSAQVGELFFERLFAPVYARITSEIQAEKPRITCPNIMCRVGSKHRRVNLELEPYYSIEGERLGWQLEVFPYNAHVHTPYKELDTLYRLAPGLIVQLDEDLHVVTSNEAATRAFAGQLSRDHGLSFIDVLQPESRQELSGALEAVRQDPSLRERQCWLQFADNEDLLWKWFRASTIYIHGQHTYFVYAIDMTRQYELEERLRTVNTTLTTTNQHLAALHHISHHNVQEPIRKILLQADRIKYELACPTPDVHIVERSAQYIHKTAVAMHTQLYALIHYTNPERYELRLEHCTLGELLDAALAHHHEEYNKVHGDRARIELDCRDEDRAHTMQCDREMTTLLLSYLVDNSVKFSKKEHPAQITLRASRTPQELRIEFIDQGIGVAPKHIERITAPFQKLDRNQSGQGMGLALCQKIMQAHQGSLTLSSQGEGHGLEVELRFLFDTRELTARDISGEHSVETSPLQ